MTATLGIIGFIIAFIIGFFFNKKAERQDAKVLDLMAKIKENQDIADKKKAYADQKVKEYEEALKKYDPGFHSDDDTDGHNT